MYEFAYFYVLNVNNEYRFGHKRRQVLGSFPQLIPRLNRLVTVRLCVIRRGPSPLLGAFIHNNGVGRVAKNQNVRLEKPDKWMVY